MLIVTVAKLASQLGVSLTLLPFIPECLHLMVLQIWANWPSAGTELSSVVAFAKEHPACKDDEAKIFQLLVVFPYFAACLEGTGKHALPSVPRRMVFKCLTRQVP